MPSPGLSPPNWAPLTTVGLVLRQRTVDLVVKGGPNFTALDGVVEPGDEVVAVDDVLVNSSDVASALFRGQVGSGVVVRFKKKSDGSLVEVALTRQRFLQSPRTKRRLLDDNSPPSTNHTSSDRALADPGGAAALPLRDASSQQYAQLRSELQQLREAKADASERFAIELERERSEKEHMKRQVHLLEDLLNQRKATPKATSSSVSIGRMDERERVSRLEEQLLAEQRKSFLLLKVEQARADAEKDTLQERLEAVTQERDASKQRATLVEEQLLAEQATTRDARVGLSERLAEAEAKNATLQARVNQLESELGSAKLREGASSHMAQLVRRLEGQIRGADSVNVQAQECISMLEGQLHAEQQRALSDKAKHEEQVKILTVELAALKAQVRPPTPFVGGAEDKEAKEEGSKVSSNKESEDELEAVKMERDSLLARVGDLTRQLSSSRERNRLLGKLSAVPEDDVVTGKSAGPLPDLREEPEAKSSREELVDAPMNALEANGVWF
eukprot:CAMPEP_0175849956 /NCGR_PEP_ID=MMETSP0107_2-20121207/24819_1 /TAXON_ID=195067 ORGANISM="Goniomonas pacifica, Strain CCMP1869" /NCGR_SAMPLE_ID=MMETSP0107_2 /ASSEMBLY_ACC=CAM_ASM_000203 /LENGTH=502 /DNA_ID=CAMNT_0017165185 /DNA_START=46 /DNA_END=1554 /DNA_ORIENTATION=+